MKSEIITLRHYSKHTVLSSKIANFKFEFSNYVKEPRWDTWEATPFTRCTNLRSEMIFLKCLNFPSATSIDFNEVSSDAIGARSLLPGEVSIYMCENSNLYMKFTESMYENLKGFKIIRNELFDFFENTDEKEKAHNR